MTSSNFFEEFFEFFKILQSQNFYILPLPAYLVIGNYSLCEILCSLGFHDTSIALVLSTVPKLVFQRLALTTNYLLSILILSTL